MVPILNHKAVEMLDKLETLLTNEFERISHYDLMFYADMTRDMLKMPQELDAKCIKQVLCKPEPVATSTPLEESKSEIKAELEVVDENAAFLASLVSKPGKGKKKGGKADAKKPEQAKPTAKPAVGKKQEEPAKPAEISKDERNVMDRT